MDGRVVTLGEVLGDRVEQVKGVTYSLSQFLGKSRHRYQSMSNLASALRSPTAGHRAAGSAPSAQAGHSSKAPPVASTDGVLHDTIAYAPSEADILAEAAEEAEQADSVAPTVTGQGGDVASGGIQAELDDSDDEADQHDVIPCGPGSCLRSVS